MFCISKVNCCLFICYISLAQITFYDLNNPVGNVSGTIYVFKSGQSLKWKRFFEYVSIGVNRLFSHQLQRHGEWLVMSYCMFSLTQLCSCKTSQALLNNQIKKVVFIYCSVKNTSHLQPPAPENQCKEWSSFVTLQISIESKGLMRCGGRRGLMVFHVCVVSARHHGECLW